GRRRGVRARRVGVGCARRSALGAPPRERDARGVLPPAHGRRREPARMKAALTIARREYRAYWDSPIAYVFLCAFLVTVSIFFFQIEAFFARKRADVEGMFKLLPWSFVFLVPLVTMRLWSEERRSGTEELLLTYPVRIRDVVVGKFLAAWALLTVALVF